MSGGQKGFTLIELLVVIAILGVIAAVVALNVSTFFGRGTVQAANTELHQVQTAIISLMADVESNVIHLHGSGWWAGGNETSPWYWKYVPDPDNPGFTMNKTFYASDYVYGPFRAAYQVNTGGAILVGTIVSPAPGDVPIGSPWSNIQWNPQNMNWEATS